MMFGKIVPVVSCQVLVLVNGYDSQMNKMSYNQTLNWFANGGKERKSQGPLRSTGSGSGQKPSSADSWTTQQVEEYVWAMDVPHEDKILESLAKFDMKALSECNWTQMKKILNFLAEQLNKTSKKKEKKKVSRLQKLYMKYGTKKATSKTGWSNLCHALNKQLDKISKPSIFKSDLELRNVHFKDDVTFNFKG